MTTSVRLASTRVGVGIRAVHAIRKGSRVDVWEPGDMVYVPLESVTDIEYLKWLNVFGIVVVNPTKWTVRARRDIRPGEELTVDYGTLDFNPRLNRRKKV